ncbi:MAG: hypothetical protein ACYC63_04645 [Armatimonadota bacterium]
MTDVYQTQQVGDLTVEVSHDDWGESPRQWSNVGHMVCFHGRYDLGDEQDEYRHQDYRGWGEMESQILKDNPGALVLPLYLYDHGGLRMKIGSFHGLLPQGHAQFDSGQVGFIYATREDMVKEWGKRRCTPAVRAKALQYIENEVTVYDDYIQGNIWQYDVLNADREILESGGGYIGDTQHCLDDGVSLAEHLQLATA